MAELGIGTRVWVGFGKEEVHVKGSSMSIGTIVDGPFPSGVYTYSDGDTAVLLDTFWNVQSDTGMRFAAKEKILFPIDDGEWLQEKEDENAFVFS